MRKLISVLCALIMIMVSAAPVFAEPLTYGQQNISTEADEQYKVTAETVRKEAAANKWAFESEWAVIGLSRGGAMEEQDTTAYLKKIAAMVVVKGSAKLSNSYSSDNSRLVLALTSIGYDPRNVNGYNLLEPLADMSFVTKQGLSGSVWALIAFDSHNYDIPECSRGDCQTGREALVDAILGEMLNEQGWAFSGDSADIDMTAMAIQALAPYCERDDEVSEKIGKALSWLSSVQQDDGVFALPEQTASSETQSQVLVALTSLGIDPEKDERFVKNGYSVIDGLMTFRKGKGFKHNLSDAKANSLANRQACYALAALERFRYGETSLYDMSDMTYLKTVKVKLSKKDMEDGRQKDDKTGGTPSGKTRSLGLLKLSKDKAEEDSELINETGMRAGMDAEIAEKEYNAMEQRNSMNRTLPWIYLGIAALAALALVIVLRKRNG